MRGAVTYLWIYAHYGMLPFTYFAEALIGGHDVLCDDSAQKGIEKKK